MEVGIATFVPGLGKHSFGYICLTVSVSYAVSCNGVGVCLHFPTYPSSREFPVSWEPSGLCDGEYFVSVTFFGVRCNV